jgi:hypothetical protein
MRGFLGGLGPAF